MLRHLFAPPHVDQVGDPLAQRYDRLSAALAFLAALCIVIGLCAGAALY